jgi:hypothetical protein
MSGPADRGLVAPAEAADPSAPGYDLNTCTSSGSCRASLAKGSHAMLSQGDEDLDLMIALVP